MLDAFQSGGASVLKNLWNGGVGELMNNWNIEGSYYLKNENKMSHPRNREIGRFRIRSEV